MSSPYSDMEDLFVVCRTKLHAWDPIPDDGNHLKEYNGTGSIRMRFRCTRCTTECYEIWTKRTGDLVTRVYLYPNGYEYSRGKVPRKHMRREWIDRWG